MAQKADITATMSLSIEQIAGKLDIIAAEFKKFNATAEKTDAVIKKIQGSTEKAAGSTNFLAKGLALVGGMFAARKIGKFAENVANAAVELEDAGIKAGMTADEVSKLGHALELSLSKEQTVGAISSLVSAMDAAKTGSADAAEALREVGVSAKTIEGGNAKDALFDIAENAKTAEVSVAQLTKVFGDNARAVKVAAKDADSLKERYSEGSGISPEAAAGAKVANRRVGGWWQSFKTKASSAYGELAGAAMDKDYDKNFEKRKADESAKAQVDAQEKANAKMAEAWGKGVKQKPVDDAIGLVEAQRDLLKMEGQSNISLESKRDILLAETSALEIQTQLIEKQYGVESLIALQMRAQLHDRHLAMEATEFELDWTKRLAENATKLKESELHGNERLNHLLANRLSFEKQIADAMRARRFDVAEQLRRQERLNELEIKSRDLMKTPQQRNAERKEQDQFDQAQRTVAARDRDIRDRANALRRSNPRKYAGMSDDQVLGRVDSRDHVSRATAKARADFAARQKGVPANNAANMALQNITTAQIIVTELKSAP